MQHGDAVLDVVDARGASPRPAGVCIPGAGRAAAVGGGRARREDQLVPHGAHAGDPAGHLGRADARREGRRLPRQGDDPLLGAHVDVRLLQGRILLEPLLDVCHDLVVLAIDGIFRSAAGTTVN